MMQDAAEDGSIEAEYYCPSYLMGWYAKKAPFVFALPSKAVLSVWQLSLRMRGGNRGLKEGRNL